jgi:putative thiamine transport system permease protein
MAIGLALVLAPSGWLAGAISPWLTGWERPPDLVTINDPFGLTLVLGLMLKELPYLLFVMLAALTQIPLEQTLRTGESLGYSRRDSWLWLVVPQVYPLVRLSVYVVLSFSMSVVDVALVLGPSTPGSLAQMLTRWFFQPDLTQMLPAAAAAVVLFLLVLAVILCWWGGERLVGVAFRSLLYRRGIETGPMVRRLQDLILGFSLMLGLLGALSAVVLVLWSLSWRWSFPGVLPDTWSLQAWGQGIGDWGHTVWTTAAIAALSSGLSLVLALGWLEAEYRGATPRARWAEALIYLPLLLPQIVLMPGLYALMLWAGLRPGFGPVIWAHSVFVFPYVMLALSDPWRRFDVRHLHAAASLGAGPFRQFATIRLPALAAPVATALAIGFTVSVALYVPTLFAGAGRVETLTTEAVALSSGTDRRVAAVYGVLQMLLPLAVFLLALAMVRKPDQVEDRPGSELPA